MKVNAVLPSGHEETEYKYGTSTVGTGASAVASYDLVANVYYPNKVNPNAGDADTVNGSDRETPVYNALGEQTDFTDRNGTTHHYAYDIVGRLISDHVTTFGSGVDQTVKQLGYTYDEAGRPYQSLSYSDAGTTVLNEVRDIYNGFGQLMTEYQEDAGTVNTTTSASVQYAHSHDSLTATANHSRLTGMTYPDGRVLEYNYTSGIGAAGIDDRISRLSSMDFSSASSTHLEEYTYLGLGTVVQFSHPESGVDLTYIQQSGDTLHGNDGGDQYTGLDRFGRVVDQWYKSSSATTDRFQYGYDEDGNAKYRDNVQGGTTGFDELYRAPTTGTYYDGLNRLTGFQRGTLDTSTHDQITGTPARTQKWTLDALGNWTTITTNGTDSNRTHNKQNQITNTNYTYDNNGNSTHIGSSTTSFAYDAWNRLVTFTPQTSSGVETYGYDALGRRITETRPNLVNSPTTHLYYSANWQVILEQTTTASTGGQQNGADPGGGDGGDGGDLGTTTTGGGGNDGGGIHKPIVRSFATSGVSNRYEYVWSPVYVDAMVLRDKDAAADNTYEERLYVQHDANFNTTAVLSKNASGQWGVKERYVYDPYGNVTVINGASGFDPDTNPPTVLEWSNDANNSSDVGWRYLFQGLRWDSNVTVYDMRTRAYQPTLGRPMQMDSAGYAAGMNRYEGLGSNPTNFVDPMGMWPEWPGYDTNGGGWQGAGGITLLPWYPGDQFPPPEIWPDFPNPDAPPPKVVLFTDAPATQPVTGEPDEIAGPAPAARENTVPSDIDPKDVAPGDYHPKKVRIDPGSNRRLKTALQRIARTAAGRKLLEALGIDPDVDETIISPTNEHKTSKDGGDQTHEVKDRKRTITIDLHRRLFYLDAAGNLHECTLEQIIAHELGHAATHQLDPDNINNENAVMQAWPGHAPRGRTAIYEYDWQRHVYKRVRD